MATQSELSKAALALPLAHRTVLNEYLWNGIHGAPPAPIDLLGLEEVTPDVKAFCESHGVVEERVTARSGATRHHRGKRDDAFL